VLLSAVYKPLSADSLIRKLLPPVPGDIRAGSDPHIVFGRDVLEEPDISMVHDNRDVERMTGISLLQSGETSRPADESAMQRDRHHLYISVRCSWDPGTGEQTYLGFTILPFRV
jgi:hypothetical protein